MLSLPVWDPFKSYGMFFAFFLYSFNTYYVHDIRLCAVRAGKKGEKQYDIRYHPSELLKYFCVSFSPPVS